MEWYIIIGGCGLIISLHDVNFEVQNFDKSEQVVCVIIMGVRSCRLQKASLSTKSMEGNHILTQKKNVVVKYSSI